MYAGTDRSVCILGGRGTSTERILLRNRYRFVAEIWAYLDDSRERRTRVTNSVFYADV